ncbi:CHAP domain-containing protein [Nonomuraea africana]|uniref:Peptidase C51 domain-containing protein n=1 Tax=Nonomuraea africana TaxID=46171 RepID=A0ABR9K5J5_9ACTN|nr:CHAP domain-containing protein [Nonomuraea africana]MBE1557283.1 hypothetical protein [Nonomuraea africana]
MTPETQKLIELLESQLGYSEGNGAYTKFGDWYGKTVEFDADYSGAPWCDMFLSWAAHKMGYEEWVGQFAYTVAHAEWFKENDAWGHKPKPGALVFYDWGGSNKIDNIDHVGIVTKVVGDTIFTIEGNIDGGVAKRKERDQSKVAGYGYPEKIKERLEAARLKEADAKVEGSLPPDTEPGQADRLQLPAPAETTVTSLIHSVTVSSPAAAGAEHSARLEAATAPKATAPSPSVSAPRSSSANAADRPAPKKAKHAKPATAGTEAVTREPVTAFKDASATTAVPSLGSPALIGPVLLAALGVLAVARTRQLRVRPAPAAAAAPARLTRQPGRRRASGTRRRPTSTRPAELLTTQATISSAPTELLTAQATTSSAPAELLTTQATTSPMSAELLAAQAPVSAAASVALSAPVATAADPMLAFDSAAPWDPARSTAVTAFDSAAASAAMTAFPGHTPGDAPVGASGRTLGHAPRRLSGQIPGDAPLRASGHAHARAAALAADPAAALAAGLETSSAILAALEAASSAPFDAFAEATAPSGDGYRGRRRRREHPAEESTAFASDAPIRGRRHRSQGSSAPRGQDPRLHRATSTGSPARLTRPTRPARPARPVQPARGTTTAPHADVLVHSAKSTETLARTAGHRGDTLVHSTATGMRADQPVHSGGGDAFGRGTTDTFSDTAPLRGRRHRTSAETRDPAQPVRPTQAPSPMSNQIPPTLPIPSNQIPPIPRIPSSQIPSNPRVPSGQGPWVSPRVVPVPVDQPSRPVPEQEPVLVGAGSRTRNSRGRGGRHRA